MIKSLTGIRFYLFLIVFLRHLDWFQNKMHFPKLNTLHWIFFTMSFFFVLSGFCIGLGYSEKFQALKWKNVYDFLKKKISKNISIIFHYRSIYANFLVFTAKLKLAIKIYL